MSFVIVVKRKEELVDSAERASHVVYLTGQLVVEHPLACFTKRCRRACDKPLADLGHLVQILPELRMRLVFCHCSGCFGMAANPVLNSQHHMLEAVIKFLRFCIGVESPVLVDLLEYSTPAEIQTNCLVLTKMLDSSNAMMEFVFLLFRVEMRIVEIRIPCRLP